MIPKLVVTHYFGSCSQCTSLEPCRDRKAFDRNSVSLWLHRVAASVLCFVRTGVCNLRV